MDTQKDLKPTPCLNELQKESLENALEALRAQLVRIEQDLAAERGSSAHLALEENAKDLITLSHLFLGLVNKDLSTRRAEIQATLNENLVGSDSHSTDPSEASAACILLVEDHPLAADIAKVILLDLNCQVDIAKNATEAIALTEQNLYDLIFMDIGLPDMDGYAVTKKIREEQKVPIIALTAHADKQDREDCLKSGMDAILIKPLFKEKALNVLSTFIPNSASFNPAANDEINNSALPDEIIDLQLASRFFNGNTKLAKKMIDTMIANFYAELDDLNQAHQERNWSVLQNTIHKLRGGIVYCGTPRLEAACMHLENYLKAGHRKFITPLYEQLIREMVSVKNDMATLNH